MKNLIHTWFFLLMLPLAGFATEVTNLKCDYRVNPVGLDGPHPLFSWEITATWRNLVQGSYEVLVATTLEKLNVEQSDVWNSGPVMSGKSIQVAYGGKPLQPGTRYYWTVRIKDNRNQWSDFCKPATFETGIFDNAGWKAKWIAAPSVWNWPQFVKERDKNMKTAQGWDNRSPMFRKSFSVSKKVKKATLYVSGVGFYEAYLNGKKLGDHLLDPAFTRYDKTVLYAIYDVTTALTGKNTIGLMLGNGWYNMFTEDTWGFDRSPWRGKPRAIGQLQILYEDHTRDTVMTDETWKVAPSPIIFNSIRQGIVYNSLLEQRGWDMPGFDDKQWQYATIAASPGGALKAQTIEPIRVYKELKPVTIAKKDRNRYIIDFGQNFAGWVRLRIKAAKGDTVIIKYGEEVFADTVFQDNIKVYIKGEVQTDKYIANGETREVFEPKFTYHGFQYAEVLNYKGELTAEDVTAIAINTDMKQRAWFSCSDTLINRIQRNTIWSYLSNFQGYPIDCPQREKNGWTGDAHLAVETGLWNFHANPAYRKYMDDMKDEQNIEGNLPAIIPSSQWGYHQFNGPDWISAYIIIPWNMYLYDGDIHVLQRHYEGMKKLMHYFTSKAEDGLLYYGLGDHTFDRAKRNIPLTSSVYYYLCADILKNAAAILNHKNDQRYFGELTKKIQKAIMAKFYNKATNQFGDGAQTNQSAPIYANLHQIADQQGIVRELVRAVNQKDDHIDAGILGAKFLLHALSDNGQSELAYKVVTQKTFPGWGWWIEQGATTLWEEWGGRKSSMITSLNHIMYGDVSNWFFRNIIGLKPDQNKGGFKHFYIEPNLTHKLHWADATFESVYGTIKFSWKRTARTIHYGVTIPGNTKATLNLPLSQSGRIYENGRDMVRSHIKILNRATDMITLELGSGNYSFKTDESN